MTVSTTTNRAGFVCNGVTYQFPFDFKILAESDLQVYLYNTITRLSSQLTLNVDYTVEIASPGPGGTVTLIGAYGPPCPPGVIPGAEYTLTVLRAMPRTQEIDFVNGDDLDEQNIEGMGDRITMMVQELDNKMARTLAFPPTSGFSNISVPDPVAGAFLRWNLSGNGLENATYVDPTLITISDYWRAVIDGGDTLPEALTSMGLDPSLSTLTLPDNVTISDFIKTLLDDADAATARATLQIPAASESVAGLAELATQAETDAGTDDARIVTPAKLYATPGIYRKNAIINGNMLVWQRGTSFSVSPSTGIYTVDRWMGYSFTDGTLSLQRSTTVPSESEAGAHLLYSLSAAPSTADTSIGASQAAFLLYKIEGYDFNRFYGRKGTLSFWVRSALTGDYGVCFRNDTATRSYVTKFTVNAANTWEKKTITVDFSGCNASGTWEYTNGAGLGIGFMLACGSTYQTSSLNTWLSGNYMAPSTQVNLMGSTSYTFYLTQVQLEVGEAATPFEHRPFAEELVLCRRYFQSYGGTTSYELITSGVTLVSNSFYGTMYLGIPMRAQPTGSYSALSDFQISDGLGGSWTPNNINISSVVWSNICGYLDIGVSGSPWTVGRGMSLRTMNTNARIYFSAEL